ncbi:carbonic anhydrase 6-like isoform X2 [Microplitis mediator]|uniref:carbonic anhydrase 6-like isoform X2 n=1 Tax=Microplitis mediator TaxID=375433 RepID=UPI0025576F7D|nr:carbonic anhydrase 6-like isoform X2 [Microplitis mediator]
MIFMFNIILVSLRMLVISAEYSYKDPDTWKEQYPQCGGTEQSPIDVTDYDMRKNFADSAYRINLEHYKTVPAKMTMKNNGHSCETKIPHVSGGTLEAVYDLHSLEFHWGPDSNSGSEHTLSGDSFPIELQLIHYDSEFDSFEDAQDYERGLTIYTTFFKVDSVESGFLTKIIKKLPDVVDPETETEIEPFAIDDLLQEEDVYSFIIYHGSQTSPPCLESVNWLIADQVFSATKKQIQVFQTIHLLDGDDHNNRPLQPLNDRVPVIFAKGDQVTTFRRK